MVRGEKSGIRRTKSESNTHAVTITATIRPSSTHRDSPEDCCSTSHARPPAATNASAGIIRGSTWDRKP